MSSTSPLESNSEPSKNNKKTISETGHARNVANLQKLIQQVSFYTLYNPPVPELTIANLQALYSTATAKVNEVEEKRNANKNAITLRQTAFEDLKATCTRIINRLEILGLPLGTVDQAKSLKRTIQGARRKPLLYHRKANKPQKPFQIPASLSPNKPIISQSYFSCWQQSQPMPHPKKN